MPELIAPTTRLHQSFLEARDEWGRGAHQDGLSLGEGDDVDTAEGFAAWVERLLLAADPTTERPADRVPGTQLWVVEGDTYLGAINLRHALTPFLREVGGHVGYGIRPSARRQGHATRALRGILPRAARLGLERVLVTCDDANVASVRTIERCGGLLEDVREVDGWGLVRRYWITP